MDRKRAMLTYSATTTEELTKIHLHHFWAKHNEAYAFEMRRLTK